MSDRPIDVKDADADARADLFGGSGVVRVWNLLTVEAAPFSAVLACELEPGASVGPHVQQRDPEIVLCLAGRGVAEIDGRPHDLESGALVHLPHGQTLALRNSSSEEPWLYLIIKARPPS